MNINHPASFGCSLCPLHQLVPGEQELLFKKKKCCKKYKKGKRCKKCPGRKD